ncbi:MAG: T9SS type A sorting domain-containing protein, partial [Candidatus Fermentibacteria bacterium]|nr:T9SS type A sorting domain-containing protein [Candidatus Fermentibacteria bacterium]
PGDVTEYRIYRQIFPYSGLEQIGTVSPGVTTFFDAFRIYPYYSVAKYHLTAWDGEYESEESNCVRILLQTDNCISTFCPVSEVLSSHSGIIREEEMRRSEQVDYSTCSVLTDYKFDRAYIPSGQAECIEIDLGALNRVEHVSVIRSSADAVNSEENEYFELCNYSLSTDGNSFTRRETGTARYVRIYGAAGATEIEIYGTSDAESSSDLINIVRNDSGAFTAQSPTGEELSLQVFDLIGRTIWEGTSFDQVSWPSVNSSGSRVPAGVYLLRVESQSLETLTTKVVIR